MGDSDLQVQAAHWPRKIGLSFCCKACSGVKAIPFPIPISELSEAADEFVEKHAMCKIAREDVVVMYDEFLQATSGMSALRVAWRNSSQSRSRPYRGSRTPHRTRCL